MRGLTFPLSVFGFIAAVFGLLFLVGKTVLSLYFKYGLLKMLGIFVVAYCGWVVFCIVFAVLIAVLITVLLVVGMASGVLR